MDTSEGLFALLGRLSGRPPADAAALGAELGLDLRADRSDRHAVWFSADAVAPEGAIAKVVATFDRQDPARATVSLTLSPHFVVPDRAIFRHRGYDCDVQLALPAGGAGRDGLGDIVFVYAEARCWIGFAVDRQSHRLKSVCLAFAGTAGKPHRGHAADGADAVPAAAPVLVRHDAEVRIWRVPVVRRGHGVWVAPIADAAMAGHADFVLAVTARATPEALAGAFPQGTVVAPIRQIREAMAGDVPAIALRALGGEPQAAPEGGRAAGRELSCARDLWDGAAAFALDRTGPAWRQLARGDGMVALAIHPPEDLPGLDMALWGIRGHWRPSPPAHS